jgi:Na+-driven multidrug efflux pump
MVGIFFEKGTEFYRIAYEAYLLVLPACLPIGFNVFGSGLFTAFGNGVVSGILSLLRTFVVVTGCLFGMSALLGGPGLWLAWPVAEFICFFITLYALKKYQPRYQY